jgi:hypothetical protein
MGYCHQCGRFADLHSDTKMCRWCRDNWRPAAPDPGDLGHRAQPQPLGDP